MAFVGSWPALLNLFCLPLPLNICPGEQPNTVGVPVLPNFFPNFVVTRLFKSYMNVSHNHVAFSNCTVNKLIVRILADKVGLDCLIQFLIVTDDIRVKKGK